MQLPLSLVLHPSLRLAALLLALHAAAAAGLVPLLMPVWTKLVGAILILASLVHGLRRHALLLSPRAVVAVTLLADGEVELLQRDGARMRATVLPQSCMFPMLIVLLLQPVAARRNSLVILPDALPAAAWRRLRTWLRWKVGDGSI